jgi:polysaccharide biosynthesis/export protein PslD
MVTPLRSSREPRLHMTPLRRLRHAGPLALLLTTTLAGTAMAQDAAPAAPPAASAARPEYRLRAGDELRVVVYFHDDLTQQLPVRPDGRIAFPLAGELDAAGRTARELSLEITARLERVLRNADATVVVERFADQRIFVGGEVHNAGVYPLTASLTCLQAVVQAGGARRSASLGSVFVIRNEGGQPRVFKLDLRGSTLKKNGSRDDVALQPLDVVFLPKTSIAKVNDFVDQYITKVVPATVILGLNYNFGTFLGAAQ